MISEKTVLEIVEQKAPITNLDVKRHLASKTGGGEISLREVIRILAVHRDNGLIHQEYIGGEPYWLVGARKEGGI
jgi:hypothetical protein